MLRIQQPLNTRDRQTSCATDRVQNQADWRQCRVRCEKCLALQGRAKRVVGVRTVTRRGEKQLMVGDSRPRDATTGGSWVLTT